MPKASKVGKLRQGAKKATQNEVPAVKAARLDADGANDALSRGQRKRQAKRNQYLRREKLILSSLKVERSLEQRKRIDGLDAMREALMDAATSSSQSTPKQNVDMLKSNKSRQSLVAKEVTQMSLVLQHPAFKADPLATLREHLQNTLDRKSIDQEAKQHQKERKAKEEAKKAHKKEQGIKSKKSKRVRATRSKTR